MNQKFLTGQAVILAAGKGTRMEPLSLAKDKPLFQILGKSILEHNLDQLNNLIEEVVLVIRPDERGRAIIKLLGREYKNLEIKYVVQKEPLGTGDAAKFAYPILKDKFLLLNGDDFYFKKDIKNVLAHFPCVLVKETDRPSSFGIVTQEKGVVKGLIEKPKKPQSNLANTGLFYLPKEIFDYAIAKSLRGEYEFTDYIKLFIKEHKLLAIRAEKWLPVSFCWNVLDANEMFLSDINNKREGKVEKNCHFLGKIQIGRETIIKSGTYIEGPVCIGQNCLIGPNCFIRKFTSIGDNCRIGQSVEIKNSIIGQSTNIAHLSYVGDSIVSDNCNLGAGTIVANLRHNGQTIKTEVKGELVDTGRKKFGTVLGEGVKTGIGTLIYPGRKIWPQKTTLPGEIVKKDIH